MLKSQIPQIFLNSNKITITIIVFFCVSKFELQMPEKLYLFFIIFLSFCKTILHRTYIQFLSLDYNELNFLITK